MKLNGIEKALMNNPLRAALQRWYEAPLLERLGGRLDGLQVLEMSARRCSLSILARTGWSPVISTRR